MKAIQISRFARIGISVTAASTLLAFSAISPASASQTDGLLNAVEAATPETVSRAAHVPVGNDEYAIEADLGAVSIDVPVIATDGIALSGGGIDIEIGIPSPHEASRASAEASGIVSYSNPDETNTVVVVTGDGTLQVNTVIEAESAPEQYRHQLSVPSGATVELDGTGGAAVVTAEGLIALMIAPPWATDANGTAVPTHYEIDGTTLVQVVGHVDGGYVYPIVADPSYYGCLMHGWYPAICVKTTKAETLAAAQLVWAGAGGGVVASALCDKLPLAYRLACKAAAVTFLANYLYKWTSAANQGKCVRFAFTYPALAQITAPVDIVPC